MYFIKIKIQLIRRQKQKKTKNQPPKQTDKQNHKPNYSLRENIGNSHIW